jgi:hypothetical protein
MDVSATATLFPRDDDIGELVLMFYLAAFLGELADALGGRRDTLIALPRDIVAE